MANYVSSYTGAQIDTRLDETILSGTASGVDTITTTISGMTYITGTKISLTTAGTNTVSAPTLNVNGLGIKTIKKLRRDSSKVDLVAGEMPSVALLEYDGTDFVLLNKVEDSIDDKFEKIETSRKRPNLLEDSTTESTDSWNTSNATLTVDTSNQKSGEGCLKITGTSTSGYVYRDVLSLLDTSSYYLYGVKVLNGDFSTGMRVAINSVGGTGFSGTSYALPTSYTNYGRIISPADLSGATELRLRVDYADGNTNFGYFDEVFLYKISPYEASLGVDTLLSQLPFMSSKGIESFDNAITLPNSDNMVDGRCDAIIEGNSNVNLLDDDDAGAESTTGWTTFQASVATDSSNEYEGTNCLKVTLTSTTGSTRKDFLSKMDTSKYYFVSAYVKNGDLTNGLRLYVNAVGDGSITYADYNTGTYYARYGIVVQPSYFDTATEFRIGVEGSGSSTQYGFIDAIQLQEITEEEYNNANTNGVDVLFDKYPYHRGLKGTEGVEVDSVGKNLLDINKFYNYLQTGDVVVYGDNLKYTRTDGGSFSGAIMRVAVESNTEYTLSYSTNGTTPRCRILDSNYNLILNLDSATGGTFTSTDNFAYILFTEGGYTLTEFIITNIQLELGSSATTYEPFKNSKASMPVGLALYSVPNGVRSSFNMNAGVEDKRVEELQLLGANINDYVTSPTNVDLIRFAYTSDDVGNVFKARLISGFVGEIDTDSLGAYDDTAYENYFYAATLLTLIVPKGTYTNTTDAQNNFDADYGSIMHYELDTYEQIQHQPQVLNAYPDGSMYKSQQITETLFYDSGLTVKSGLTPSSAVKVVKIDGVTGEETQIALSDVTVGSPTTISGASDSEIYRYTYRHSGSSTGGKILYRYCLNDKDQKDGNSDSLKDLHEVTKQLSDRVSKLPMTGGYTLEKTIASGVITIDSYAQYHIVDTESDGATDDLDTINGGEYDGQLLVIRPVATGRTVVAKDGTGNLLLAGDFSMDSSQDVLTLVYVVSDGNWREVSRSNNA